MTPRVGVNPRLAIFVLALTSRLAAVGWAGWMTMAFGDGPAYLFAARELARTGHYPVATEAFYFRAPGYPVFLAAITLGHPEGSAAVAAAKIANALLGAFAVLLLVALSARLFQRPALAVATGVAAALHPGLISLSTDVASEPLFLILLLAAACFLLTAVDRPSSRFAVLAGAAVSLAALTRPSALVVVPFLAAPLFDRRYAPRARASLVAFALLGFVATLAPWTIRNAIVFHELVPINDAAGSAFYQGNSDWMIRFYALRSQNEYLAWSREMFEDLERQTSELTRAGMSSPWQRSRAFFRKALAERAEDPAVWVRLLLRKAWDFVRPGPSSLFWPWAVVAGVSAVGALVTLLAAVGLFHAERRGVRALALAFLAVTLASHTMMIVVWRYRIPYWDPVLLLYAAPGGAKLVGR